MPEPIKISEQGRALSCDEYDSNLDILRDRANHTGTQSCNTLNDLDSCLATSDTIDTINTSINTVTTRVINLENTLSASGSIANDLNSLEASLTADINENRASITTLETDVDNLEIRVSGVESNLVSLTNVVTLNNTTITTDLNAVINTNNAQNTRLTNVENRATTLNANILSEAALRQSDINNLQAQIDTEEINRINGDTNLLNAIDTEEAARINSDVAINNSITNLNTSLLNTIYDEVDNRTSAISNLQSQLNNLTTSLSSAIPTATVLPYLGNSSTVPTGFLYCAGAAVSRTTYASLFNRIGTRYGVGNGTTTFNLPDFRDQVAYGAPSGTLDTLPISIGVNNTLISVSNLPPHNHNVSIPAHSHTVDIQHKHHLYIHPHNHTTGNVGSHAHSLAPFRLYSEGNGDNNDGAELTNIAGGTNTYPNTQAATAAGPVVNPVTVGIWNPPYTGRNETDVVDSTDVSKTTSSTSVTNVTSGNTGVNQTLDIRQKGIQVNYIIKT